MAHERRARRQLLGQLGHVLRRASQLAAHGYLERIAGAGENLGGLRSPDERAGDDPLYPEFFGELWRVLAELAAAFFVEAAGGVAERMLLFGPGVAHEQ